MEFQLRCILMVLLIFGTVFLSTQSEEIKCEEYSEKETQSVLRLLLTPRSTKVPRDEVKFYLFTRKNQNCFQAVKADTLKHSFFNPAWSTRIIIHGWMSDAFSGINQLIKNAYLTKDNYNVIIVEWGNLAKDPNYDRVSKWVDNVGELIAEFIMSMKNEMNISCDTVYLIGHSLGAHIAGAAGHLIPEKLGTIFALDPAEPNFENPHDSSRINTTSARYVESIQTHTGLLGVQYPVGHASFFPNYGRKQKGCGFLKDCSHARSYEYFAESINSKNGFWGIQCSSMEEIKTMKCTDEGVRGLMGGDPTTINRGYYYVPVNWHEPFAKGADISLKEEFEYEHHHHKHHDNDRRRRHHQ